jgi:hypothetical protein
VRRPSQKAILFFVAALVVGYVISIGIMIGLLNTELRLYGFGNVSLVALLIAFVLLVWLDKPFELKLFEWPAEKPKTEETPTQREKPSAQTRPVFPHEIPTEHWEADFADPKQVYEGTALPIWLLAGWAIFIIWAVVYLVSGLPTALQ